MNQFDANKFDLTEKDTYLLEASAGTGKTYNIAVLALRFILEQGIDIQRILIVTFTKAAVDELKIRIKKFLNEAYLYINKKQIPETNGVEKIIKTLVANDTKKETDIKRRIRSAILNFDEASIFTIHSFCQRMLKEFAFETGQLFDFEIVPQNDDLLDKAVMEYWRENINKYENEEWIDANIIGLIKSSVTNYMKGKKLYPAETESDKIIGILHDANKKVIEKLNKIKEEHSILTFDDLINRLHKLTTGKQKNEQLIKKIAEKYDVIFIDEFQDTDKKQAEIFSNIFENNGKIIFYIGDPKQSIYSFRNADIYAYLDVKKRILNFNKAE